MAITRQATAFSLNPAAMLFALGAVAAAGLAVVALSGPAKAGASFDGAWRVTIITQAGNCDPAYSYPVRVEGGRVSYAGDGSFDISGHVGEAGTVSVTIARGDQKASGSGKLSANSGSGQWSGKSSSTACSGRWEAARNS
ncbi:hypothetical protein [Bradyrhizobium sp. G127]|jgi:hypothetical protein|uniref:hypothetical protein n=1 Tax=Bradyrhizobium sp. G127 TaxID=2904800 RepID=UPI001F42414D|nr:hypothetical protein [Bradyrhizobium sp. G127]MCF2521236.1 hypothetical protein [Bradyrhizobium sp. G127]